VKIVFEQGEQLERLRPGLSVNVGVRVK
jgi:hypothetical protein